MAWVVCNVCQKVVSDLGRDLSRLDEPAPCCGGTGCRTLWPSFGFMRPFQYLQSVSSYGLPEEEPGERPRHDAGELTREATVRSASVFLCAQLEALVEDTLWTILGVLKTPRNVALALMHGTQGRHRLLQLYKALTGTSAKTVLANAAMGGWHDQWDALVQVRNDLAHGTWHVRDAKNLAQLFDEVHRGGVPAIVQLRNFGLDEAPKHAHLEPTIYEGQLPPPVVAPKQT